MKVLICIPCLMIGGTEIQTLSLVKALVVAGHKPIVVCYFEYEEEMVARYREAGAEVKLMSPDCKRPSGIKNICICLYNGLKRIVKEVNPDIAHIQYMTPAALVIVILRMLGIKKIVATSHTDADIYSKNGLKVIRFLTKWVLSGFQCITLRAEKSFFGVAHLFNGTRRKHFTIYNSLPSHIKIKTEGITHGDIDTNPLTVGVVSRLEKIKGMDLVIPAFAKANKNNTNLQLLIVGDGSLRKTMVSQVEEAKLTSKVKFVGCQPQEKLQEYYDQIDILLMPSRSEGFGLTAIEGMARGCVPVVANTGGLPEVVTSDCGFLHTVEDISDIADKINLAASDLYYLSGSAIKRVAEFSKENYNYHIKNLYNLL